MKKQRKILFVAMHHSIHTARWIDMVADTDWALHVFPLDAEPHHSKLRNVTLHRPSRTLEAATGQPEQTQHEKKHSLLDFSRRSLRRLLQPLGVLKRNGKVSTDSRGVKVIPFLPTVDDLGGQEASEQPFIRLGESENAAPSLHGPGVLASVIRRVKPDLIHSMEFQHAGYLVLRAKELYGAGFPPWLASNWGSDIFYFGRFYDHRAQITRLLENIDFYSCECRRDVQLARDLGYRGPVLPVLPNSGGFDLDQVSRLRSQTPPSRRKVIMVKGYEHFAGRAMTTLKVLQTFATQLQNYEIIMFSVSAEPRQAALDLAQRGVLNIRVIDWANHEEILSCFGRARIYIGISISDAISTSVLEAMAMGAFPIQTNTSCCDEWFDDGVGGFLVPHDDFDFICRRFRQALEEDHLVDRAAEVNAKKVAAGLDKRLLRPQVIGFYDQIFGSMQGSRTGNGNVTRR